MARTIRIGEREIGSDRPVYIVAELSANHHHNFHRAVELIEAARQAGADAVKLQTYTPDTMTIDCSGPDFRVGSGTLWEGRRLYELYGEAHTPWGWHSRLFSLARERGLDCFSTPFDSSAVEFLEELDAPAYKIASFEIVDLELIRRVAATGKPLIMSTGMASLEEIEEAVRAARDAGATDLSLLKCTSAYPASAEEMNLRTIPDLARRFDLPVGLSDHTLGAAVPIAAVTLGACIVEKHFTLSRSDSGPDAAFSLEPNEFAEMVRAVRTAEKALGAVSYTVTRREQASRVFRRSLFVVADVRAGEPFSPDNVRCIRPGSGLSPKYLEQILRHGAACDIKRGTPMSWDLVGSPVQKDEDGESLADEVPVAVGAAREGSSE